MTEVVYFVASSLDGCVATAEGGVEWLSTVQTPDEDYGYQAFYDGVDALVMGRATYDFVAAFDPWPYAGKPAMVLTSRPGIAETDDVRAHTGTPTEVVADLRQADRRRVWLVGGGRLANAFLAAGLIDELILSLVPVVLGNGVRLFQGKPLLGRWDLRSHQAFDRGLVQLHYRRKVP